MTHELNNDYGKYSPNFFQSLCILVGRRTPILKTFFRTRLNRVLLWLRSGPVDEMLFGLRHRFHTYDSLADRKALFSPKKYDLYERVFLANQLREGGVFLDIGSNVGVYSLYVAATRGDVHVHAFEPIKKIADRLKYNVNINKLHDQVRVNNIALADCDGEITFNYERESLVFTAGEGSGDVVPCLTLKSYIDKMGLSEIDAIKIDVEGAEDKILKPFFESVSSALWPKYIVIEHLFPEVWAWNCISELEALGYRLSWKGPMNTIYEMQMTD